MNERFPAAIAQAITETNLFYGHSTTLNVIKVILTTKARTKN